MLITLRVINVIVNAYILIRFIVLNNRYNVVASVVCNFRVTRDGRSQIITRTKPHL